MKNIAKKILRFLSSHLIFLLIAIPLSVIILQRPTIEFNTKHVTYSILRDYPVDKTHVEVYCEYNYTDGTSSFKYIGIYPWKNIDHDKIYEQHCL